AEARRRGRRTGPRRTALPVPARGTGRRVGAVPAGGRGLVPGRAAEPGRVVPDPPPPDALPGRGPGPELRRPFALPLARRRPLRRPRGRAGAAGRRCPGQPAPRRKPHRLILPAAAPPRHPPPTPHSKT